MGFSVVMPVHEQMHQWTQQQYQASFVPWIAPYPNRLNTKNKKYFGVIFPDHGHALKSRCG